MENFDRTVSVRERYGNELADVFYTFCEGCGVYVEFNDVVEDHVQDEYQDGRMCFDCFDITVNETIHNAEFSLGSSYPYTITETNEKGEETCKPISDSSRRLGGVSICRHALRKRIITAPNIKLSCKIVVYEVDGKTPKFERTVSNSGLFERCD